MKITAFLCVFVSNLTFAAISIPINNFSFETGGFEMDFFSNTPGVIPAEWSSIPGSPPTGSHFGYLNPDGASYSGTTGGSATVGTMAGGNVFYFGSAGNGEGIQQALGIPFSSNTDYNVMISVGTRILANMNDLKVVLIAGSTTILSQVLANPSSAGNFVDQSVTYTAQAGNNGLDGETLTLQLIEFDAGGEEVDIDNVRLTAQAVPEPAVFAAWSGLCALALVFRYRRR